MLRNPRHAVLVALVASFVLGLLVLGRLLYVVPVGLDASTYPLGEAIQRVASLLQPDLEVTVAGIVWFVVLLLLTGVAATWWVRRAQAGDAGGVPDAERRGVLRWLGALATGLGAVVLAGAGSALRAFFGLGTGTAGWAPVASEIQDSSVAFTHPEWKDDWRGSRIVGHRPFGRTGWNVSDVVLGTGRILGEDGEQIARMAIDRGVNYLDTSPDYSGAGSENAIGKAIRGVRDQLFIATKFCTPIGHLAPGTSVARYKEVVEESLGRLQTDYVDLVHVHSCNSVDRLMDPNVHEAFDRLKEEGKVRFLGFSSHTPNLVEVAQTAIDSGRFDVMMLAYHHGIWPEIPQIIHRAREEQDMGVVAMKTLKGAKHRGLTDFQPHADAYSQAALKWALSNPEVSCAVISFFKPQHVDEYLAASGRELTSRDVAILDAYDREIVGTYCAPHCGACLTACPEELAIHDVLRHRMYFEDYGWEKEGMRLYAALEKSAAACASCTGPCLGSCPVGIDIPTRMRTAHELLS